MVVTLIQDNRCRTRRSIASSTVIVWGSGVRQEMQATVLAGQIYAWPHSRTAGLLRRSRGRNRRSRAASPRGRPSRARIPGRCRSRLPHVPRCGLLRARDGQGNSLHQLLAAAGVEHRPLRADVLVESLQPPQLLRRRRGHGPVAAPLEAILEVWRVLAGLGQVLESSQTLKRVIHRGCLGHGSFSWSFGKLGEGCLKGLAGHGGPVHRPHALHASFQLVRHGDRRPHITERFFIHRGSPGRFHHSMHWYALCQ